MDATVIEKSEVKFSAKGLEKSDAELVKLCRKGDEAAWNALVDRYQRLVFAVPRRAGLSEEQASDVFQEVFMTLFEKLDDIEQPEKVRSWLVTTAKFKTWGTVRSEKGFYSPKTEEEMEFEMASLQDNAPLAEDVLIELEQQHLIRTALKGIGRTLSDDSFDALSDRTVGKLRRSRRRNKRRRNEHQPASFALSEKTGEDFGEMRRGIYRDNRINGIKNKICFLSL